MYVLYHIIMSNDRKKEISLSFEGIENDLAR